MKFISSILAVITLVIYIFAPILNCGVLNDITGFKLTETIIDSCPKIGYKIAMLIPFIGCFASIFLNHLKREVWSKLSLLCMCVVLFYIAFLKEIAIGSEALLNILGYSWGWSVACIVCAAATITCRIRRKMGKNN